jgi:hypothetical protein
VEEKKSLSLTREQILEISEVCNCKVKHQFVLAVSSEILGIPSPLAFWSE